MIDDMVSDAFQWYFVTTAGTWNMSVFTVFFMPLHSFSFRLFDAAALKLALDFGQLLNNLFRSQVPSVGQFGLANWALLPSFFESVVTF